MVGIVIPDSICKGIFGKPMPGALYEIWTEALTASTCELFETRAVPFESQVWLLGICQYPAAPPTGLTHCGVTPTVMSGWFQVGGFPSESS